MLEPGLLSHPETAHDRETCSVDDREIPVTIRDADLPGGFQVRCADRLYNRYAVAQALPEPFGGTAAERTPFASELLNPMSQPRRTTWTMSTNRLLLDELSARLDAS